MFSGENLEREEPQDCNYSTFPAMTLSQRDLHSEKLMIIQSGFDSAQL